MTASGTSVERRNEWVLWALAEYEGRLVRYAIRLLSDEDAARDAVQHVFLQLCDQSPEELDGRLAAWLYTVCRNRALDLLRQDGRHQPLNGQQSSELEGRELDPATSLETHDLHVCLLSLVAELPDSQREVIDLWLDGFSYREIAQVTNRSATAVRVAAHRAMTRLRRDRRARELLGLPRASAVHDQACRQS